MNLDFVKKVNDFIYIYPASWESGDRTISRNEKIGGAKGSYHLKGLAIDLVYDSLQELWLAAQAASSDTWGFGGVEVDLTNLHLHLDLRPLEKKWHVVKGLDKQYSPLTNYLTKNSFPV